MLRSVVLILAVLCAAPLPQEAEARNGAAARPADAEKATVAAVQEALTALGYDPGPVDGVAGARTRMAISAFQKSAGLPADGRPSEPLLQAMTAALGRHAAQTAEGRAPGGDSAAEAAAPPAVDLRLDAIAPAAAAPSALAGTRWRIDDPSGARFEISLEAGGGIGGVAEPRFWSWRRDGGGIRIAYDNGWGARVVRTGRIEGGRLTGAAVDARGRRWDWQATRLAPAPAPDAAWPTAAR